MKYCIGCIHCVFEPGEAGYCYSTYTWDAGEQAKLYCAKKHWHVEMDETTRGEFEQFMEKAEGCPDFIERTVHDSKPEPTK